MKLSNSMQVSYAFRKSAIECRQRRLRKERAIHTVSSTIIRGNRKDYIVATISEEKLDYVVMAGDCNCSDTSDVHRFLMGDCSLGNMEANPNWYDLALSYAGVCGLLHDCVAAPYCSLIERR